MSFASLSTRLRSLAGFALALALVVTQVLPWPAFGPGRAAGEAKAAAIRSPLASETCMHHPQGCPPDCHCPKLHSDPGDADAGTVAEPTLVRCTAHGTAVSPAPADPCMPVGPIAFRFPERIHTLPASLKQATAQGFRLPLAKIPIA